MDQLEFTDKYHMLESIKRGIENRKKIKGKYTDYGACCLLGAGLIDIASNSGMPFRNIDQVLFSFCITLNDDTDLNFSEMISVLERVIDFGPSELNKIENLLSGKTFLKIMNIIEETK